MNIKKLKVNRDPIEKALAGAGVSLAVGLGLAGIVYGMEQSDELKMKTSSNSKQSTTQEDSTELNTWYTFGHIQEDGSKLLMQLSKDEVSDVYLDENGFPVILTKPVDGPFYDENGFPVILTKPVDGPLYDADGNVIEQSSDAKTKVK